MMEGTVASKLACRTVLIEQHKGTHVITSAEFQVIHANNQRQIAVDAETEYALKWDNVCKMLSRLMRILINVLCRNLLWEVWQL